MSAAIVAYAAISALGEDDAALGVTPPAEPARVAIAEDASLRASGFARPLAARVTRELPAEIDRGTALLAHVLARLAARLDDAMPSWRERRVGLVLGTSSGGMESATRLFAAGAAAPLRGADQATYFAAMGPAVRALGLSRVAPASLVLTACAASTLSIGLGARFLAAEAADLVVVGGFDAHTEFVASGFEVLRATTGTAPPKPFGVGRDGMVLGEGAAVLALVRADRASNLKTRVHGFVRGFGASADAVHLTAPDRTGAGLARAAEAALADAGISGSAIDIVSAHATATPFNDPAECAAIRRALGDVDARAKAPVLHAFKAQVGHTLGAAGALELLTSVLAIERGVFPATPITSELEPDLPGRVLAASEGGSPHLALKLSAAFGGANASLVVSDEVGAARARVRRPAFVGRAASSRGVPSAVELASKLGVPVERFARADALVRAAIAACASLCESDPSLRGATATGVVVGHALATVETNASFDARRRERGPRAVEPRKFPYTSPNAVAGECGAFFGWNGPGLAVGAGLHGAVEALAIAATLVEAGDAERVVVVGVDELGATSRALADALGAPPRALEDGAVAVVVSADPGRGGARVAAISLGVDVAAPADPSAALGHRALLPLTDGAVPPLVAARCPSGAYAEVRLEPGAHRE